MIAIPFGALLVALALLVAAVAVACAGELVWRLGEWRRRARAARCGGMLLNGGRGKAGPES